VEFLDFSDAGIFQPLQPGGLARPVYSAAVESRRENDVVFSMATTMRAAPRNFAPALRLYHVREKMPLEESAGKPARSPRKASPLRLESRSGIGASARTPRVAGGADLRGPRLHMMLAQPRLPASRTICRELATSFRSCSVGPWKICFCSSGHEISDPAELVSQWPAEAAAQRVEALFDWIIIDSPPAVPVSDASVLAKACDGVLMVVRSNTTPVDMARRARQEFPR